ncbi:hypothetical protein DFH07DRAFT_516629 [Mycena maculata]|uniref:Uncharacterized protein n=1 Tax=Mycena maculata TaxID=230809 RepID=A0AAD7J0W5_9AGAR|nr:hypothetical protein DFH07DRAFT_516629 [Mycena maculata]
MQLQLLPIGLLALLVSVAAQADPQPSADVLNNENGMTPCEMQESWQNSCNNSRLRARDDNDENNNDTSPPRLPAVTPCTCTNLYFNLWSACLYTKTGLANTTLPVCENVIQACAQSSLNITSEPPPSTTGGTYPVWAYNELPASNDTFDLAAAIEAASATQPRKWTAIQIVLPIIVVILAALIGVGYCIYRRRKIEKSRRAWMTTGDRPRFHFPTISSAHKVRPLGRSSSWSIDEQQEDLEEYQFVSYPASLQGSHVSGHVRLSSSSSGTTPGPPTLKIPAHQAPPLRAWPGKAMWKGPLQSARQLRDSIPRPWSKRVTVKSVPGYGKFRVDASDSDSPLSQHPHEESLLGHTGRSRTNLHNEAVFEREDDEDSDTEAEALPLIPEQHSHLNHDAEPPSALLSSRSPEAESLSKSTGSHPSRQIPPSTSPPRTPLPPPPPPHQQQQRQEVPTPRPDPTSPAAVTISSGPRIQRPHPAFPPAPTAPPPPLPTVARRSPRTPRTPLPPQPNDLPPLPSSPSPALSPGRQLPPPPSRPPPRQLSTGSDGSSVRSLPSTPTPPYDRHHPPTPIRILDRPENDAPPNSAPPYIQRPSQDYSHSPVIVASPPATARSVRRLPLPPS